MRNYLALVAALVVVTLCLQGRDDALLGTEVSRADAATVVGGDVNCGATFGTVTVNCKDDENSGAMCNGEEVLCSTASNEASGSTGSGDRAESLSAEKDCKVCSVTTCGKYPDVIKTKDADCNGE